jgi:hypothetical protein
METFTLDTSHVDEKFWDEKFIPPAKPSDLKGQIYIITSKTSGKSYIGQTRSHRIHYYRYKPKGYLERWKDHIYEALKQNNAGSECVALNNAIRLYGVDDFEIELLDTCDLDDDNLQLNELEKRYIEEYNTLTPNGYNLTIGGSQRPLSKESIAKMTQKLQVLWSSKEKKIEHSLNLSGKKDDKKITKYKSNDVISGNILSHVQPSKELIFVEINYKDGRTEKISFGTGKRQTHNDIIKRVKKFINEVFSGKPVNVYDNKLLQEIQNSN